MQGKNSKCFNCGKLGHLSCMCRSRDLLSKRIYVNAVENNLNDTSTFTVFGAESQGSLKPLSRMVVIGGQTIEGLIDTGS